ncbi:hypothetical protein ACTHPF_07185 [Paenibacillus sp. SAF-054]|uniref:hypothetical protein n=1 Tax=unclassified Paenibacillus TaxID=185978 RepID=UPI003F817B83
MAKLLSTMGWIWVLLGILLGFIFAFGDGGFHLLPALFWWCGGVIAGILFVAFSIMLDYLEENNAYLRELLDRTSGQAEPPRKPLGNSKASMKSLRGFTMKSHD